MPVHSGAGGTVGFTLADYELRCSLRAPLPIDRVFAVFEDPRNLARLTPAWLRFSIRSRGPLEMKRGLEIDYTIRWLGLPMSWRSVISEYDPPRLFVDEQIIGPYKLWHHRHEFIGEGEETMVSDRVRYALPFGRLGRMAHRAVVRRQLRAIFDYRQKAIAELIGARSTTIEAPTIVRVR